MAVSIFVENCDLSNEAKTKVNSAVTAGSSTITVINTSGMAINDFVLIVGDTNDTNELKQISTLTATTITLTSTVSFAHALSALVIRVSYDKLKVYRSTSELGTYTEIAQASLEWANDTGITGYYDTTGTSASYYKASFVNSYTNVESGQSGVIRPNSLYCNVEDVLSLLGFEPEDEQAPKPEIILKLIESRSRRLDSETNSSFIVNSITSEDYQYVDGRRYYTNDTTVGDVRRSKYYLGKAPIISATIQSTQTSRGNSATWTGITEGRDNDYIIYKDIGIIEFVDSSVIPSGDVSSLRWTGTWGRSDIPTEVSVVVAKGVCMDLAGSTLYRAFISGRKSFDMGTIDAFQTDWKRVVQKYINPQILTSY